MSLKILLADDHKIVRDGLQALLSKEPGMEVVGEAKNGRSTVKLVRELKPDVVVMDISMPDLNGIDATRQIIDNDPSVKVIALSMHSDKRYVKAVLLAGASAYLLKESAFQELAEAIRTVVANRFYLNSAITDIVVKDYLGAPETKNGSSDPLTLREREVLQLLAEGKSTKVIASTLNVSIKTVESHRQKTMHKLNIYSIAGLTRYAIREGLVSLDS
ncbi:response regulator transcription factor [bacterium]|nr:response regulator transcription factor [bacterium]